MSGVFGRTILNNSGSSSAGGAGVCGRVEQFCQAYYRNYIATSSVKPVLHVIGFYSIVHWSITQTHKHKYQTKREHH